jgi:tRNA (guanine-N7-)-methyltransferase
MGHKKLQRFTEIGTFPNVLQYPEGMSGKWHEYFNNTNPITLELACGKGEYTVGLASVHPERNFIGIDLKGNRMWVGAKKAIEEHIKNVAFLRTHIDKITQYFDKDEVSEIWITFPDPHLRNSRAKKRLTHPQYLRLYRHVLKKDGLIHLKTDSPDLYEFTKTVIGLYDLHLVQDIADVHNGEVIAPELKITTYYESLDIAKSKKVFYLCFTLPVEMKKDDEELKAIIKQQITDNNDTI